MHWGGVARSAGGAERSSRGREGEKFLFSRVLRANPVAQAGSLFPLKLTAYSIQSYQFFDWMAGRGPRCPSVWSGGQALGAVFNQLVRSRAQLLGAVVCSK